MSSGSEADSTVPSEPVVEPTKCQTGFCQVLNDLIIQHGVPGKYATQVVELPNRVERCVVNCDDLIMVLVMLVVWCWMVHVLCLFQGDCEAQAKRSTISSMSSSVRAMRERLSANRSFLSSCGL